MTAKTKSYLDFIPFVILIISAVILLVAVSGDILLVWKHYVGFVLLLITGFLFYYRHLYGVLGLGATLIVGLIGLLSFSPAINTFSFGWGDGGDGSLTLLRFQPIFLLWLTIYFLVSGRFFVGISSNKYWQEVDNKER